MQEAGRTDAVLAGFAIHGARRPPRACVHGRGRAPEVIRCLGLARPRPLLAHVVAAAIGRIAWCRGLEEGSGTQHWCAESELCADINLQGSWLGLIGKADKASFAGLQSCVLLV